MRDLVVRARSAGARDERIEAYGRLVEQLRDMACGYAYSILGDFHLAQDAAQEAFIAAFEKLPQLQQPEAFAGWLRRIVWSCCGRMTRRSGPPTVGLDSAADVQSREATPAVRAQADEMRDEVLRAIAALPESQREVTTLFYINGYSQADIADFLEVPVGTVKNRLSASRGRLKQRMLNMVKDTLHNNAPDERFDKAVIEELLSRPRPLEIPQHPVRQVWDAVRRALGDYEVIEGDEVIDRKTAMTVSGGIGYAYPDPNKVLRTCTTVATYHAMAGRTPPVRLLTAGRVFRVTAGGGAGGTDIGRGEDAIHMRVFHMVDALCIAADADRRLMQATLTRTIQAALESPSVELKWEKENYPLFEDGLDLSVRWRDQWLNIAGCGTLPPEVLRQAGYDPQKFSSFAFGLGLERLAMLRFGIDDIRKLWQPPYIP